MATTTGWLDNDKILIFSQPPDWVGLNSIGNHNYSGELIEGSSDEINLVVENINLPNGQYTSFLNMTSNGSQSQSFQITLNSLDTGKT